MTIRYISLFSGCEAFSVAVDGMDFEPVAFAEIEPAPSAILAYRYPDVPNLGDVTKVDWTKYRGAVELVVGGFPCQDFSVAGKREGAMGQRGSLMFEYIRAVGEINPTWFIAENVPGFCSSDEGRAMEQFLQGVSEYGYSVAWRVLDAQFHGLAQRRKRIFLVGHSSGEPRYPAAVIFDQASLSWDSAPSREQGERSTRSPESSTSRSYAIVGNIIGRQDGNGGNGQGVQPDLSYTLTSTDIHGVLPINCPDRDASIIAFAGQASGKTNLSISDQTSPTLTVEQLPYVMASSHSHAGISSPGGAVPTLTAHNAKEAPILLEPCVQ